LFDGESCWGRRIEEVKVTVEVTMSGKNIEVTEGLRVHAERKASRLGRMLREKAELRVVASVQKGTQVVEMALHLDTFRFRAEGHANDMYQAMDAAFAKLRRQIVKLKDRWQSHGREEVAAKSARLSAAALAELRERFEPSVSATGTYTQKPMTIEEACLQLEMCGRDFLPFVDESTGQVHVVYRVGEEHYGLLKPEGA
jgi:putative sigma-54 modulation protein